MEDRFSFYCDLVGDGGYKSYEHPTSIVFNFLPSLQVSTPSLQYYFDVFISCTICVGHATNHWMQELICEHEWTMNISIF